jgi:hypothetical protein
MNEVPHVLTIQVTLSDAFGGGHVAGSPYIFTGNHQGMHVRQSSLLAPCVPILKAHALECLGMSLVECVAWAGQQRFAVALPVKQG